MASPSIPTPQASNPAISMMLPYPPSLNRCWRKYRNRMVRDQKYLDYRLAIKFVVADYRYDKKIPSEPMQGLLRVSLLIHPPDNRRRDLDNTLKAILDSLQYAEVYTDDWQVRQLIAEMGPATPGGRVLVKISEVSKTSEMLWRVVT